MNPVSKFTPRTRRERPKTSSNSDLSDKGKDALQVFCRLCPIRDTQSSCVTVLSPTTLSLSNNDPRNGKREVHCQFKHIFTSYSTQKEVFEHVAYPLIENLLHGKNGLIFTYGVTGSGKTYTLNGEQKNPGIIPKCIYTVFNSIGEHQAPKFTIKSDRMNGFEVQSQDDAMQDKITDIRNARTPKPGNNCKKSRENSFINDGIRVVEIDKTGLYSVFVSYIEIYNNTVYDLLDESSKAPPSKILREDAQKNMYVNNLVEVEVKSAEEAFRVFNTGKNRKKMANTLLNADSSRSHSIFNIRVVQLEQSTETSNGELAVPEANMLKVGRLSLVDLAGSERTNRTQNTGVLLKEASQINNSLMSLRACLDILRENQQAGSRTKLIPYRSTRLTLLFRNYFEGDGQIEMIVCMNPSAEDFEENLQVVKFAESTQEVKVARAEVNYTPLKRTIEKKPASTVKSSMARIKTNLFTFGTKLPEVNLSYQSREEAVLAYEKLEAILQQRIEQHKAVGRDLHSKEKHLRERILNTHQNNLLMASDLKSTKIMLEREKCKVSIAEQKLNGQLEEFKSLQSKEKELESVNRKLKNTIKEQEMKINKKILENERTKQKMVLQNEQRDHELDEKLRRQREHLRAAMKAKEQKIQKVKEILEKEVTPSTSSEEQLYEKQPLQEVGNVVVEPSPRKRAMTQLSAARRRRSRSAGETWLEHNAVKPVALGTVLQPSMKKRKSVTKLTKAADITNPKQSKYCLIAQEQDTDGEVETKLYKADIVPTCGGGAQVVFNDVERLRQESPNK